MLIGFSQLVVGEAAQSTTLGSMIVVSGAFLLLMLLIKKFAWGKITDVMQTREEKIANDLDSAEKAKVAAAQLEKERQQKLLASKTEAADIMKQAQETGAQTKQKLLVEAQDETQRLKTRAKQDIAQERQEALANVKEDVAQLSLQIAEKILTKELNQTTHESLIDSYIESLGQADETR